MAQEQWYRKLAGGERGTFRAVREAPERAARLASGGAA